MSKEKVDLEQVRNNLSEVMDFKKALSQCQVPGNQVVTISKLQLHLEDVIKQLSEILQNPGDTNE
jgi:flagellar biosynthesis chaperone FliJ